MTEKPEELPKSVAVSLTLEESSHLVHFVVRQLLLIRRHKPSGVVFDTAALRDHQIEVFTNLYAKLSDANDTMMGSIQR